MQRVIFINLKYDSKNDLMSSFYCSDKGKWFIILIIFYVALIVLLKYGLTKNYFLSNRVRSSMKLEI